jgi:predicted transcriptional regulator
MSENTSPLKQQAHELIDNLPESATWDDVAYAADLRASIDRGLADSEAGRILAVDDLIKELGLELPALLPPAL